jgi:hypothetical protein
MDALSCLEDVGVFRRQSIKKKMICDRKMGAAKILSDVTPSPAQNHLASWLTSFLLTPTKPRNTDDHGTQTGQERSTGEAPTVRSWNEKKSITRKS